MDKETIRTEYNSRFDWLDSEVMHNLGNILDGARKQFHQTYPNIARPKTPEYRVKGFAEIIEKLERKNKEWPHDKLFVANEEGKVEAIVDDLVAGRIVCATPNDVENIATILKGYTLRLSDIRSERVYREETGYRAYHIDARIQVFDINIPLLFPVEIQIKTLLQDAWSNFGHDEFYKPSDEAPKVSRDISRYLADTLAGLDMIGQSIRDEKLRKLPVESERPEDTLVTQRTLNYLAGRTFHVTMNEVELQKCVQQLKAFGYIDIASVSDLAEDKRIGNIIEVAKARLRILTKLTPYEILFFGPLAAVEGEDRVVAELRRIYGFTTLTCDECRGPISTDDKVFVDTKTDLDGIYLCETCRTIRLKTCSNCERLSEAATCKDCRAQDESIGIV